MKRVIKSATSPDVEYNVTVGFCGFIGVESQLVIDARVDADKDELLYIVQEDYAYELLEGEVVERDDDLCRYVVEVTFDGQLGSSQTYNILANDDDEAIDEAIEEAKDDLEIIEFHEL